MASNDKKIYYWLQLDKDFFKRSDIRIIESMADGKEYILFYLKLLCESTTYKGDLNFKENLPYSEETLATITNTNIDIVHSAIKVFKDFNMLEIHDNNTFYMLETPKMLGCETGQTRRKKEAKQGKSLNEVNNTLTGGKVGVKNTLTNGKNEVKDTQYIRDKSIDIKDNILKEKIYKKEKFVKPTVIEIEQYCRERKNNINATQFYDYYESKGWLVGKAKMKDWRACIRTWEANNKNNTNNNANNKKSNNPFIEMLKNLEEQEQEGVNNG